MKKRIKKAVTATLFFLMYTLPALAVDPPDIGTGLAQDVSGQVLADKILGISVAVGALVGAVCVAVLIYNGFKMTTATNEQKRAEAKDHIMYAFGGVAIVALALTIVGFVINVIIKA